MAEHKQFVDLPLEQIIGDRFEDIVSILSKTGRYQMLEMD